MAEVHKQAQFATGCAEVIQELRAVLIDQGGDGFDFEDDLVMANEVRGERLNESTPAILQSPRSLRLKWDSLQFQFDLQALVINRLEKAAALLFVNGKTRADDGIAFILIKQFGFSSVRVIRVFRGLHFMLPRLAFTQEDHADRRYENENADDLKWQIIISEKQQADASNIIECRSWERGKSLVCRF